jgi:hypothetical protein
MERWNIRPASLILLGSAVFVILLLVVLPNVDPLDTAFQRGTAPITIHAEATSLPPAFNVPAAFVLPCKAVEAFRCFHELRNLAVFSAPNFLPILLRSIRR